MCHANIDTLSALVDDHLVRRRIANGEPRFELLETIREYAFELGPERDDAQASHAAFIRELVEQAQLGGELTRWLPHLDVEIDNVRVAPD